MATKGHRFTSGARQTIGQTGPGYLLSNRGKQLLRGIRDHVDADGAFYGTARHAAELAGMEPEDGVRALTELGSRGFVVRLVRARQV